MIRTLIIAALLMLAVACGGDAVPTATSVPPTSAPFVPPTAISGGSEVSSTDVTLLNLGPLKNIPTALGPDSPRLPADEVERIWTEWMTNTARLGGSSFWEFCAGGVARGVVHKDDTSLEGEYTWSVNKSRATAWNVASLILGGNEEVFPSGDESILDLHPTEQGSNQLGELLVFEHPTCGQ